MAAGAVLLLLGGFDPVQAFTALADGAFGSWNRFLSITLVRTVPLALTGLAVALAFRAGVWNIGAEGQFYAGAVAATWLGLQPLGLHPLPGVLVTLAFATVAGALWTLLPALMRARLGVGEVITTILMNFVAINLVGWLINGPLQESRGVFPQSDPVASWARLSAMIPGTRLHWGLGIAVVLAVGLALWLKHSPSGFRVRVTGLAPEAAAVSGRISTGRLQFRVFLVSGAIAGLAGGVEVSGVTFALFDDLSPGYGYTAIAVALLGGLNPLGVLMAAVLLGGLEGGAGAMQRDAGIPSVWVVAIEAIVILSVLALQGIRRRADA
jgi:simple sugar transport system permease protein